MFECKQGIEDKDVSLVDVMKVLTSHKEIPAEYLERLTSEIISL